jgi:hypothetical protein
MWILVLALMWCVPGAWGGGRILPLDHDFGEAMNLRGLSQAAPARAGYCLKRDKDGRVCCTPDVMFIGASKAGTSSFAQVCIVIES